MTRVRSLRLNFVVLFVDVVPYVYAVDADVVNIIEVVFAVNVAVVVNVIVVFLPKKPHT